MAWRAMDPLSAISDDSSSDSDEEDRGEEEKDEEDEEEVAEEEGGQSASGKKISQSRDAAGSQKVNAEKRGQFGPKAGLDYDALSRHGYSGGPSILYVPPPKTTETDSDWSWSNGKRKNEDQKTEESFEGRELTREIVSEKAPKMAADALSEASFLKKQRRDMASEQRALTFSQKEKRKRDLGQASRGKNYVEEEKRLLRDAGVHLGFDV